MSHADLRRGTASSLLQEVAPQLPPRKTSQPPTPHWAAAAATSGSSPAEEEEEGYHSIPEGKREVYTYSTCMTVVQLNLSKTLKHMEYAKPEVCGLWMRYSQRGLCTELEFSGQCYIQEPALCSPLSHLRGRRRLLMAAHSGPGCCLLCVRRLDSLSSVYSTPNSSNDIPCCFHDDARSCDPISFRSTSRVEGISISNDFKASSAYN